MSANRLGLGLLGLILLAGSIPGQDLSTQPKDEALQVARQMWAAADLVLEKHVTPPTRHEMFLAALRSMTVNRTTAANLARRVSDIREATQLAPLVQEFWPQHKTGQPASAKELAQALVGAMLQSTPGAPMLIPPEQHKIAEQLTNNRYVGIGVQVSMNATEQLVEILNPVPGGPARKAGARPGDLIVELDGVSMAKLPLGKVVDLLRGEEGSQVRAVVQQKGSTEKRTLTMTRSVVPFAMLVGHAREREDGWNYRVDPESPIAYVRALRLTSSSVHELRQIEQRTQDSGCQALILDLRFTMEGDMQQGARVADALLDGGLLAISRDRQNNVKEYQADADCLFRGWPMVVLLSPASRGAGVSLLTAALQNNRRAIFVGEAAPADPYVSSTVALPEHLGFVQLPTAVLERRLPNNQPRMDVARLAGVQPEHPAPLTESQKRAIMEWQTAQERPGGTATPKAPEDPGVAKALELLRAKLKTTGQNPPG